MTAGGRATDAAASPQSAIAWTAPLPNLGRGDKLNPNLSGIAHPLIAKTNCHRQSAFPQLPEGRRFASVAENYENSLFSLL
jgi:hypothetical protein